MTEPEAHTPTVLRVTRELRSHYGAVVPELKPHIDAAKSLVALFEVDLEPDFLDTAQHIRLECARLLAEHGTEFASNEDWTVESLTRDMLHLAAAIETGQVPAKTDTEEAK